jgi:hypothetical protein
MMMNMCIFFHDRVAKIWDYQLRSIIWTAIIYYFIYPNYCSLLILVIKKITGKIAGDTIYKLIIRNQLLMLWAFTVAIGQPYFRVEAQELINTTVVTIIIVARSVFFIFRIF